MSELLIQELKKNPFLLAPMAGITESFFRSFMKEMGCGIVTTELVSVTGLCQGGKRSFNLMSYEELQRPVGVQLFGSKAEEFAQAAQIVEEKGADFIDLNLGCPVPKVVKKGAGSALLKDLTSLRKILRCIKKSTQLPISLKIRTGWDEKNKNALDVVQLAGDEGVLWVSIHGRTRAAGYSGLADWDYIAEVKAQSPVPVIGNGDLTSASKAVEKLKVSSCNAVMIGRGCLKNPWIFQEALALWKGEDVQSFPKDFYKVLCRVREHLDRHYVVPLEPEKTGQRKRIKKKRLLQIKKMAAWYASGFPYANEFRRQIFSFEDEEKAMELIKEFFRPEKMDFRKDTSHEPFLMGGHG